MKNEEVGTTIVTLYVTETGADDEGAVRLARRIGALLEHHGYLHSIGIGRGYWNRTPEVGTVVTLIGDENGYQTGTATIHDAADIVASDAIKVLGIEEVLVVTQWSSGRVTQRVEERGTV